MRNCEFHTGPVALKIAVAKLLETFKININNSTEKLEPRFVPRIFHDKAGYPIAFYRFWLDLQ